MIPKMQYDFNQLLDEARELSIPVSYSAESPADGVITYDLDIDGIKLMGVSHVLACHYLAGFIGGTKWTAQQLKQPR